MSLKKQYCATVILVTRESPKRILLIEHRKYGVWLPPGGHQEDNENHYEAAIRETLEETGIDISPFFPAPITLDDHAKLLVQPYFVVEEKIDALADQPTHYHLDMIFVVELPHQEGKNNIKESHSLGWFTVGEIETIKTFPNVRTLITKVLSQLK